LKPTKGQLRLRALRLLPVFLVAAAAGFVPTRASAYTESISGNLTGTACTSTQTVVPIYWEDFEEANAAGRWSISGNASSGRWEIGLPQASWTSQGYKQLSTTPSQQLDPRFFFQSPHAMVTGLAAPNGNAQYDPIVGTTDADSNDGIYLPAGQTVYMDVDYYLAYSPALYLCLHAPCTVPPPPLATFSIDFIQVNAFNVGPDKATWVLVNESGGWPNKNASWNRKTVNLTALGINGPDVVATGTLHIAAQGSSAARTVEAAVDDILIYTCR
jgi:hypothetical protein